MILNWQLCFGVGQIKFGPGHMVKLEPNKQKKTNSQSDSIKGKGPKSKNIRIFNGCEVQIENSVTGATVQQQEVCQLMQNSFFGFSIYTEHPL